LLNIRKKYKPEKIKRLRSKQERLDAKRNSLGDKRKDTKKPLEKLPLPLVMKKILSIQSRKLLKKSKSMLLSLRRKLRENKEKHIKSFLSNKMK
jgi:hypothetical protein